MFALFFVNLSTYVLLNRAPNSRKPAPHRTAVSIPILTFAAAVFRGEIALYLAPLCLQALFTKSISFSQLLKTGVVSGILSALLTITVDSYFWNQKFLWPEFAGLFFNVVEGKSTEWGTSPPLTYFTSFLPKLLLSSLPLSLLGISYNRHIRGLLFPSILFIVLISFLGHKEWRFIIYVVPVFNIAAARGLHALFSPRKQRSFSRVRFILGASLISLNIAFTVFSTAVSIANYPGGQAMRQFHALYNPVTHTSPVHVHISNLAAQSGASLFTQLYSQPTWPIHSNVNWIYNKTESLTLGDLIAPSSPFTHLILEERPSAKLLDRRGWKVVSAVDAFEGVKLSLNPASIKTAGLQLVRDPSSQSRTLDLFDIFTPLYALYDLINAHIAPTISQHSFAMKIFRKLSLRGFNTKVKAKFKAKSCLQLPVDQLSFDGSIHSEKHPGMVQDSPHMDGRTVIPRHHDELVDLDTDLHLTMPSSTKEERVKSWFSATTRDGGSPSESVDSVMVLNEGEYRAETEDNGQSSPLALGDLTAQQYAHLRDSGLISTSFDDYRPIADVESGTEDESAQRHPKLTVIFTEDDDSNERDSKEVFLDAGLWAGPSRTTAISSPTSLSPSPVKPGKRKSSLKAPAVDAAESKGGDAEDADTGFYIHDNDSMSNLPGSIDSKSTNLFSEEPFSPQFVPAKLNVLDGGSFASCDSITTEDNAGGGVHGHGARYSSTSIDKLVGGGNATGTPQNHTTGQLSSPVAPPNTPWESGHTPDALHLVTRTAQESTRRRSRGPKNANAIPKCMFAKVPKHQSKVAFEEDYSFISFSTPTRVALAGTQKRVASNGGGGTRKIGGQMVAKAVKAKFNKTFKKPVDKEEPSIPVAQAPSPSPKSAVPKRFKSFTPPLSKIPVFVDDESANPGDVTPVSDSPPVIQCPEKAAKIAAAAAAAAKRNGNSEGEDTVLVSSFAEGLNKALDMLECLAARNTTMAPTVAYVSVTQADPNASVSSDSAEGTVGSTNGSPMAGGAKLERTFSRFSEELAGSDTDDSISGPGRLFFNTRMRPKLPTKRGTRDLAGKRFGRQSRSGAGGSQSQRGVYASKQYRKVLELYTLQYQLY
ncbi:hypothetical protein MD484_g2888, partial [Candolleomyces efflorescens]